MPALHIRNVPESVMAGLRERAARNERSVQEEVRVILSGASAASIPTEQPEPLDLVTVRVGVRTTWAREDIYDDADR